MTKIAHLPDRRVLQLTGPDRVGYLQGLVSNDVAAVRPGRAVWTGLLTPQGRYLADFFIVDGGDDRLLLDVAASRAELVRQKLLRFKLRAEIAVADTDWRVGIAWDGEPPPSADNRPLALADPRLAGLIRLLGPAITATHAPADWDEQRLALGLPETIDLEPDRTLLLEAGFDELHGVSWTKGCYMGQELTARTKYRGLVKKRLLPVRVDGRLPEAGAPIFRDGAEVGSMRSGRDAMGMALLRLDAMAGDLRCGEARLVAWRPDWMILQGDEA